MSLIEEKITVYAPVDVIWKALSDKYLSTGVEKGGQVNSISHKKRGVKFKILDFKVNESLTIVWYSLLVKLVFYHKIKANDIGCLVTCAVNLKGFFSFIIKPLIESKIREHLRMSLKRFSGDLNRT